MTNTALDQMIDHGITIGLESKEKSEYAVAKALTMRMKCLPCNIKSHFEESVATIAYGKVIGQLDDINSCRE